MSRRAALAVMLLAALAGPAAAKDKPPKPAATTPAKPASAADNGLDFANGNSGQPVEIYADQGLELSQDAKTVIGRVNAKAIRGSSRVDSDVLIAHYRQKSQGPTAKPAAAKPPAAKGKDPADAEGGSSEIWRVEAEGHVIISSPSEKAYGDHADYNIDDAVVVLTGKDLHLVTPRDTVTARDTLEYWEQRQQAVARGDAVAVHEDKRIRADTLVADFAKDEQGKMSINRAHGYDHVVLTTATEVVTGDRADYNVETGIVIVTGSVKITRDQNQLDGGYATVNLNTGISKIFPAPPGVAVGDQRVKGLLIPQHKQGAKASEAPAAAKGP